MYKHQLFDAFDIINKTNEPFWQRLASQCTNTLMRKKRVNLLESLIYNMIRLPSLSSNSITTKTPIS